MKQQFEEYLIKKGYQQTTQDGRPSTIYAYIKRIDQVCDWEQTDWRGLADRIGVVVCLYGTGGAKEDFGNRSHKSVINALKRLADFLAEQSK